MVTDITKEFLNGFCQAGLNPYSTGSWLLITISFVVYVPENNCLNPYSTGSWLLIAAWQHTVARFTSLNPYSTGSWLLMNLLLMAWTLDLLS